MLTASLKSVLGRTAKQLTEQLKLETVEELLRWFPRTYLDLGHLTNIGQLPLDQFVSLVAEVESVSMREMRTKRGRLLNARVTDGDGVLEVAIFNPSRPQVAQLQPGSRLLFSGKVTIYNGTRQLAQPLYQTLMGDGDNRADLEGLREQPYPVYPTRGKITSHLILRSIRVILDQLPADLPDPVPEEVRLRQRMIDLRRAFGQIHHPHDTGQRHQAERRFRFEEAFVMQTALGLRRMESRDLLATPSKPVTGGLLDALDQRLPFELTAGQREVGEQITADLGQRYPMHRLLQGEVGAGKTLVALRAMLTVVDNGGQTALLAPTEVLATQHHRSITAMLGDLAAGGMLGGDARGTQVVLLTGSLPAAARRRALLAAASGEAGIVVGTHALLQEKVQFADLGLVVVDEQHRFGVEQRDALRAKGRTVPHLLVMTATPIPRTVAMTVFGDLETSTLRELPKGRSTISTHVVDLENARWMARTWQRLAEEAAAGHQAYVVCARIGDEEGAPEVDVREHGLRENGVRKNDVGKNDVGKNPEPRSLTDPYTPAVAVLDLLTKLRAAPAMAGLTIEALHGRMPADARDEVMRGFAANRIHVLVSTTVIEVGVDVPNATAMVVMNADRFGVSQLHQLRGRIGRGSAPGLCLLVREAAEGLAADRLDAVAASTDGFELARVDLEQRREGNVLGNQQSGSHSSLRRLRVLRDEKLIVAAREEVTALLAEDPKLAGQPLLLEAIRFWLDTEQEAYLDRG